MIRDPGGANPNENLDSPPSPKYDRIIGRPPPLDDTETPLDMTVRRKDSSDGQGSPTGASGCDQSRDVPINLNVRPSVITKAPPPPIKKRISHMHTNGEIVLKSSVKTTSTTTVELSPIVNVSSTYCDVSIEEHFRRSLGPTYSSIYGDKQQLQQSSSLNMTNNNTSTNQVSFPLDPSMHHAQQNHPLPLPLLLQKHVMETSESLPLTVAATGVTTGGMRNHSSSSISSSSSVSSNSSSSSNSSCSSNSISKNISMRPTGSMSGGIRAVAPDTIELKLSSDPAPPIPLVPATVLPPSPGAPSPAAGLSNPTTVAISLTSPKHLHQQPPPPAVSPASLTTTMSLSSSSPSSSLASSPAPFLPISSQHQKRPDSGEEVDDHFAKALGDTWKKIQENKMNL